MIRPAILSLAIATAALTSPLYAQDLNRNDPNRPSDKIAADLGVTESEFTACFWNVNPDMDHAPNGDTQRANKSILLPCLQQANPEISNDMLDTVMDRYRPEGPLRRG